MQARLKELAEYAKARNIRIYLAMTPDVHNLVDYKFQPHWRAERGEHGLGSDQHGKDGAPCIMKLPLGTVVTDVATGKVVAVLRRL